MNKVSSIEIAGQVFWINESAYSRLQQYLSQIRQQLTNEESADDIYQDIELRIAELLYTLNTSESRAISGEQLNTVIEQVGFLDSDEEEVEQEDVELPRKSFRDTKNRILGGVCAGLAIRLSVPAFVLRVVFIALAALFGFGVLLYLIFWMSLDSISTRNASLAAHGKAQTAKSIATFEEPRENPLYKLQRIVFLPFSIVGTLIHVVLTHFKNRRSGYVFIAKNIVAVALLFFAFIACLLMFSFYENRYFHGFIALIVCAAVLYLILLGLTIFFKEFYLNSSKLDKRFKTGALFPVAIVALSIWYLNAGQSDKHVETTQRNFAIESHELIVNLIESEGKDSKRVGIDVRYTTAESADIGLSITYTSYGKDQDSAAQNIESIDYFYTLEGNQLTLDKFWQLKEGKYNRGQDVELTLLVPEGMTISTTFPLVVESMGKDIVYHGITRRYDGMEEGIFSYLASNRFMHESGQEAKIKLSDNEREIMNEKFCQEFFISDAWACRDNIRLATDQNKRFDKAFEKDSILVDNIRIYLQPDRSLFTNQLLDIQQQLEKFEIQHSVKSEFQQYVEHLVKVKTTDL